MAAQGNNGEQGILVTMHGTLVGLDSAGNIHLETSGRMDSTPSRGGVPGVLGKSIPFNLAISAAAGTSGSNISNVSFQMQDRTGAALAGVWEFDLYLSDAATGVGLTATTASGGIAAAASSGTILGVLTTSKAISVATNAAGLFTLAITDTAKTAFYPCAFPVPGFPVQVGTQLITANYG